MKKVLFLCLLVFVTMSCVKDEIIVPTECVTVADSSYVLKSDEIIDLDLCPGAMIVSICTNSDCKWQSVASYQYYPACIKCGSYCTPVCIGK